MASTGGYSFLPMSAVFLIALSVIITSYLWSKKLLNFYRLACEKEIKKLQDEDELKKADIDWNRTFNSVSDSIFIQDANHIILKANKAFLDLLGLEEKDVVGHKCHELVHKLGKPWPGCPAEKTMLDRKPHTEEVNDPTVGKTLLVSTSPIFDENNHIAGTVHVAKDISELKKSSEALEESEIRYRTMYDSSNDAVMILDPNNGFLNGNNATLKIFGCKDKESFIALHPSDVSPKFQPDGLPSLEKSREMMAMAMKNGSNLFEWVHKRITGEEFYASVLLTKMIIKGVPLLQATVRDISASKNAEEELRKKVEDLERFQKIMVGRELKMKELKAKIEELETKLGETKK